MMKYLSAFAVLSAILSATGIVRGHGTPIVVNVVEGRLDVSGGTADTAGFAPMIFVESTSAGDPSEDFPSEPFGPVLFWNLPGFHLNGLELSSGLYLEVLPRPVLGSEPVVEQLLWHWDPVSEAVVETPADAVLHIINSEAESLTLLPGDSAAPPPFFVAEPLSTELGAHKHLLGYALDNDPPAVEGAYGFFARLSSDLYATSDPFLVVLNNMVSYSDMVEAALAINAAAVDPNLGEDLFGDYNGDNIVDAADYTVWRDAVASGATTLLHRNSDKDGPVDEDDYAYWRDRFGQSLEAPGSSMVGSSAPRATVPEAGSLLLAAAAWSVLFIAARKSHSYPRAGLTSGKLGLL
jgi:hypothetical protein